MKKTGLVLVFVIACLLVNGQQLGKTIPLPDPVSSSTSQFKTMGNLDTLNQYQLRSTGYILQNAFEGGYVYGTAGDNQGGWATLATGVQFDSIGPVEIKEVFVWIGYKNAVGSSDVINVELYNVDPATEQPDSVLGFGKVSLAFVEANTTGINFNTMEGLVRFVINQGSNYINGDFVVALNYSQADDTLGIVSNQIGDGLNEGRVKQFLGPGMPDAGTWKNANEVFNGFDTDAMMIPIVEFVNLLGREDVFWGSDQLKLMPAFPNPSSQFVTLNYEIPSKSEVQVSLWDASGKVFWNTKSKPEMAGKHSVNIPVHSLSPGSYYYTIKTSETAVSSKVQISN